MDAEFFEIARDAVIGFVAGSKGLSGACRTSSHARGLKVWFDDDTREHYEAQLVSVDGAVQLEIGFHSEHPKAPLNAEVLQRLVAKEGSWRRALGDEAVAGEFLGRSGWTRISELWPQPGDEMDEAIEAAARLTDYIIALEPLRRA